MLVLGLSNQQMQIMMQQQQMTQQSYAHPNYGQPMYPTIPIRRFIPPPPGFLQNPMPPNYPYNGTFTPAFGPHQHVNSNSHLIRTHPGANQHVNYQNPHLTDMHSRATYKNTNQQPMYGSTQNQHVKVMVFNATFNNISVISWQSVLLVEETRVPGENHCGSRIYNYLCNQCYSCVFKSCSWQGVLDTKLCDKVGL
jgi:hypothetical protein